MLISNGQVYIVGQYMILKYKRDLDQVELKGIYSVYVNNLEENTGVQLRGL